MNRKLYKLITISYLIDGEPRRNNANPIRRAPADVDWCTYIIYLRGVSATEGFGEQRALEKKNDNSGKKF